MKINIFDLKFDNDFINEFCEKSKEILTSGIVSESKFKNQFESEFSQFIGCKYSSFLTSGTAALEIALKAINVENKEVIIPSNTFFATANAVRNAGGILKLVDIEKDTFSIDPNELVKNITINTKAVIIVHIGGIISKHIEDIVKICKEYNIALIEDAAHAHGSKKDTFVAGTIGDIACFSFFPTKVMTTGEGGMITTNNTELFEKCTSLRNFGRDIKDAGICINDFGNNYKVSEFNALLGLLEMKRVKNRIERRKNLAKIYKEQLGHLFKVFYDENISFYKVILEFEEEKEYKKLCKEKGISLTGEVYKIPVHQQPLYKNKFDNKFFPVTNSFSKKHICPPLYPELSEEQIYYTCNILMEIHENKNC